MATREAYVRTSVTWHGVEYIVGLALWPKEPIAELVVRLRNLMDQTHLTRGFDDWHGRAEHLEDLIKLNWPGRPYFIEVGSETEHWVQLFQPWDLPIKQWPLTPGDPGST